MVHVMHGVADIKHGVANTKCDTANMMHSVAEQQRFFLNLHKKHLFTGELRKRKEYWLQSEMCSF